MDATRTTQPAWLTLRRDLFVMGLGGAGRNGVADVSLELSDQGFWPTGRAGFDLSQVPQPERRRPDGSRYSLAPEELCDYGRPDPRSLALATERGRAYWEPRLRGHNLLTTWDGSGGGGNEIFGGLQVYLEADRIRTWLRPRLERFLVGQGLDDDPLRDARVAADEDGRTEDRTIALVFGWSGCVGRSLSVHLPYLLRAEAATILRRARVNRRLRLLGFALGPSPYLGLQRDAHLNWLSAVADFEHIYQHGYEGVFEFGTLRPPQAGRDGVATTRWQQPPYDELYLLDGPAPREGEARLSDEELLAWSREVGRRVALRLLPAADAKIREVLVNPPTTEEGQGTGPFRTLRATGIAAPAPVTQALARVSLAEELLAALETRVTVPEEVTRD